VNAPAAIASGNPFPGLRPFREDEEYLFFGRDAQVDTMVDRLGATRFLAVVGTSGSGKSSLVNCGLIPALHRGLMASAGSGWRVATLRPGNRPIHALAEALARPDVLRQPDPEDAGFTPVELVEATLRMSKLGLLEAYQEAPPDESRRNLLVVADQFEELFRYRTLATSSTPAAPGSASEEAVAFVNLLQEVAGQRELPVYVVITMRSDFLGECAQFFGLPEAINRGQYLVPRMTRDERRAAIAGPLNVCGADIHPALLTRLVNDVGDNPDQLSLLQHALNRTWARWREEGGTGLLEPRHYDAVGTMAGALNQHAEEAYAALTESHQRTLCEALFKAITDKGTDARGTRRPTRLDTLCEITGATAEELAAVMAVFRDPARAFLMPPHGTPLHPDTPVDISHESLMRVWERLRAWSDDEAQSAQTYRRLAETAELHAAGRAGLLGQPDLQVALDWRHRRQPNVAWAERYRPGFVAAIAFLEASAKAFDEGQRAEAARQAEAARLRQQEARSRLNARWLVLLALTMAGSLSAMSYLYILKTEESEAAQRERDKAITEARRAHDNYVALQAAQLEAEQALAAQRRLEDAQVRQDRVIAEVTRNAPQLRTKIDQAVDRRPLVYLQYADARQGELAERIRVQLNKSGYTAPGFEKVAVVPATTELRYFRKEDGQAAKALAELLKQSGIGDFVVKFVPGFESRTQLRQFEIWLARPDVGDLGRLVQNLNSDVREERLAAGQALQSKHSASPAAIAETLALFSPERINGLSAEGRINALYFLSRTAPGVWTPELERRGRELVARVEEREKSGVRLGEQTRAELKRFVAVLDAAKAGRAAPGQTQ